MAKTPIKKIEIKQAVTRDVLASNLADVRPELSLAQAKDAVNSVLDLLKEAMVSGRTVILRGVLTARVVERKARTGYDMVRGKALIIPKRKLVKVTVASDVQKSLLTNKPSPAKKNGK